MEIALDEVPEIVVTATPRPDPSVVEDLYRERGRQLWAFGRRLGLQPEECDDAVQEAHLRLWTRLADGAAVDDPAAWLFRVFYRLAMDRHRLSRRVRDLLDRWPGHDHTLAADPLDGLSVWAAVDRLPPRQRAAVYLHYRADLTFDRVGVVMGITPGAARTYTSRGLATIRERLTPSHEADR